MLQRKRKWCHVFNDEYNQIYTLSEFLRGSFSILYEEIEVKKFIKILKQN